MVNTYDKIKDLDNIAAYIKNKPIRKKQQMQFVLKCTNICSKQMNRLKKMVWSTKYEGNIEDLSLQEKNIYDTNLPLRDKLLSFGGKQVAMVDIEQDIDDILERGQLWYGDRIKMMKGYPSQCHSNSAELWEKYKDNSKFEVYIVTGYGLSDDGLWRQHSWCVLVKPRKNRIIETTVERIAYFGFVLTKEESEVFALENYYE